MVQHCQTEQVFVFGLSVLALSSRFDGRAYRICSWHSFANFQYSLCRVVLMVKRAKSEFFRYAGLSVLALSSRFDGPAVPGRSRETDSLSVLALSSRFDGRLTQSDGSARS